jgi:type VI secretion system protein ImpA
VSNEEPGLSKVTEWLQPLADGAAPCGSDLEYDNEFLQLNLAAQGKPETQFGPGEPPDWRAVSEASASLMGKSRDIRLAVLWVRAQVNLHGFSAFPVGLQLIEGLLANFWDHLHPVPDPDDQDPFARANALALLPQPEGLLGDLRQCLFFELRGVGELRLRSVEIAMGQYPARADENVPGKDQIVQMIASAIKQNPALAGQTRTALAGLASLGKLMTERFGVEAAPDLRPLTAMTKLLHGLLPVAAGQSDAGIEPEQGEEAAPGGAGGGGSALSGAVRSREDALRAIDMVCDYLDRTEPTNPAQLMLRRSRKLLTQNFLQLMKELAPEALNEVARVMGVDPESVTLDP